jgi:FtsH-binding integral membrane protein
MLVDIAGVGIIMAIVGIGLILGGSRRRDIESTSVGGLLLGAGTMVLAVQFFYIFQLEDEGGGYDGTAVSEAMLGIFLMTGFALIVISLYGWATHRLFWQFFVNAGRT